MTEQTELLQRISCKSSTLRGVYNTDDLCNRALLCRAVILRAFQDAGWELRGAETAMGYRDACNNRASALLWLRGTTHEFFQVCRLADCDPHAVMDAAKNILGDAIDELQIPVNLNDARAVLAARSTES